MPLVARLIDQATATLAAAGVPEPRVDAELLVACCLGLRRTHLLLARADEAPPHVVARFDALLARRAAREPLAYLLGEQEFRGLRLVVDHRVLVPRWDTEPLVDALLELTADRPAPRLLADVGTGSGAVAVALADADADAQILACDWSDEALEVARANAAHHHLTERIHFVRGDLAQPLLAAGLAGRLDGLFANLPYVPTARVAALEAEVRDWEPRLALDGGADGLDLYRRLAPEAMTLVADGGTIVVEADPEQIAALGAIFREAGELAWLQTIPDLTGRPRGLAMRRAAR